MYELYELMVMEAGRQHNGTGAETPQGGWETGIFGDELERRHYRGVRVTQNERWSEIQSAIERFQTGEGRL